MSNIYIYIPLFADKRLNCSLPLKYHLVQRRIAFGMGSAFVHNCAMIINHKNPETDHCSRIQWVLPILFSSSATLGIL